MSRVADLCDWTTSQECGRDTFVVNFFAFFDDAGTDERAPFIACAGYLAQGGRWDALTGKWHQMLRSYHIPASAFSMKSYANSTGPFRSWKMDERRRRSFMANALRLIQQYVEAGFCAVIRKSDYDTYLSDGVKARIGGYFPCCAEMCVGLVEFYMAARANRAAIDQPTEHLEYVFEKGSKGAGHVQTAFEEYYWGTDRLWCRDFSQETKDSAELHVADILAYEMRKNMVELLSGQRTTLRHPLKTLMLGVPHIIMGLDGPELAEMDETLRLQNWVS
jgi:hypothetical protein